MVSKKIFNFITKAIRESLKSEMRTKHGAIIVNNNKIISVGYNQYDYNMFHKIIERKRLSIHAEIDAINKCEKRLLRGSTMYVIRYSHIHHQLMDSSPCPRCQKILKKIMREYGLQKVIYSINIAISDL